MRTGETSSFRAPTLSVVKVGQSIYVSTILLPELMQRFETYTREAYLWIVTKV